MASFQYTPLSSEDEIRVLDLLPGPGPISCRLRHARLSEKPPYEALSYCWGTSTKMQEIYVDGIQFSAGENLYFALQYLRGSDPHRTMWIDAICINQKDAAEKNTQVPLMSKIYEQCVRTVIWLGPPNILTRRAFRVLRVLMEYSHAYPLGDMKVSMRCWRHAEHNLQRTTGRTPRTDKKLRENWFWDRVFDSIALEHLWALPWFTRVWILQEAAVCPEALLKSGPDEINWAHLVDYSKWNETFLPIAPSGPVQSRIAWIRDPIMDHFDVFSVNEDSSATNPRDKIYGVMAFIKHNSSIGVKVDYSKSCSEVFIEFTAAILKNRVDLDVLSRSHGTNLSYTGLPSWSLGWGYDKDQIWIGRTFAGHSDGIRPVYHAKATRDSKAHVEFSADGRVLGLLGTHFDEVTAIGIPMPDNPTRQGKSAFRAYLSWREICSLDCPSAYGPTNQSRREVFWKMLRWCELVLPIEVAEETEESEAFDRIVVMLTSLLPKWLFGVQVGLAILSIWHTFIAYASLLSLCAEDPSWIFTAYTGWNRTMVKTQRGYIGLGPATIRIGDKIFLVQGSKSPLAFRQNGRTWKLVGETYVHGIMDGEEFDESSNEMIWID